MAKYFNINGYFKDDHSEITNCIIKDTHDVDEKTDFMIFFYGLSETDIKEAIELKEDTSLEFVITSYSEIELV